MDDNIKNPQDALEWVERHIHEEAKADGEMSNEHAIQLAFIQNMLAKFPRRNCDVGTAEEQYKRFMNMCNSKDVRQCAECSMRGFTPGCSRDRCFANWAQMLYKEGGAK